jgi:hypothetical protein
MNGGIIDALEFLVHFQNSTLSFTFHQEEDGLNAFITLRASLEKS